MRRSASAGCIALACLLSPGLCAQSSEGTIEKAVATGDPAAIMHSLRSNRANPVIAAMAKAMATGDAAGISTHAERCIDGAMSVGVAQVAVQCASVLAGTRLSAGDIAGWSRQIHWLSSIGLPALREVPKGPIELRDGLDVLDFDALAKLPHPQLAMSSEDWRLPIDEASPVPVIEIDINGKRVRALVDTGVVYAAVVTRDAAEQLGINIVADHLLLGGSDSYDPNKAHADDALGLIDRIEFGPFRIQNLGVVIIRSGTVLFREDINAIIGLPLLMKLKAFEFDSDAVGLYAESTPACKDPLPIWIGNNGAGWMRINLPLRIADTPATAFFDTGMEGAIAMRGAQAERQLSAPVDDGGSSESEARFRKEGEYHFRTKKTALDVTLSGRDLGRIPVRLIAEDGGIPVALGARSIPDTNIRVMPTNRAMCLLPRQAGSAHD